MSKPDRVPVGSPCTIEGCDRPVIAKGWCSGHYHRWQRYGDPEAELRKVRSWNGAECMVEGCGKPVASKGRCENHYVMHRRRSNPEQQRLRNENFRIRNALRQEALMGRPRPERCEICNSLPRGRGSKKAAGICFDHDHASGEPRGWLCDRRNKVLGLVGDSTDLLAGLIEYLRNFHVKDHEQAA